MISKDGKVFGKINIVDLIIIIVLVFSVGLFAYTKIAEDANSASSTPLIFEFYTDELPEYVVPHVKVGSKLFDNDTNLELGEVTGVKSGPAVVYNVNEAGETVTSEKEGYKSIRITGKVKGALGDFGVEISGHKYGVGHSMTLRVGTAKIYLKISDIREA